MESKRSNYFRSKLKVLNPMSGKEHKNHWPSVVTSPLIVVPNEGGSQKKQFAKSAILLYEQGFRMALYESNRTVHLFVPASESSRLAA